MTVVIAVLMLVGVLLWRSRRKARRVTLAGLNGERPQFFVEPPRRSVATRRETL